MGRLYGHPLNPGSEWGALPQPEGLPPVSLGSPSIPPTPVPGPPPRRRSTRDPTRAGLCPRRAGVAPSSHSWVTPPALTGCCPVPAALCHSVRHPRESPADGGALSSSRPSGTPLRTAPHVSVPVFRRSPLRLVPCLSCCKRCPSERRCACILTRPRRPAAGGIAGSCGRSRLSV